MLLSLQPLGQLAEEKRKKKPSLKLFWPYFTVRFSFLLYEALKVSMYKYNIQLHQNTS